MLLLFPLYFAVNERRFIILDTIESGKSATGNTILYQTAFESQFTPHAVTKQVNVCRKDLQKLNKNVVVVDTPGIRVTRLEKDDYAREVIQSIDKAVKLVHPGSHAYLLVLSIPRFSELDTQLVKFIRYQLKRIISSMIIIFTGYDVIKTQNQKLNEFKEELPDEFKKFIDECQKRVLVFNNGFQNSPSNESERTDHNNQVAKLLQKVEEMPDSPMDVHQNKSLKSRTKLYKL
jgi:predicted GTPase